MVKKGKYIPDRGDIVLLNFMPQTGHKQNGRRPAIVLSPKEYNSKTGLALFCPITSKVKGYPFEVLVKSKKIEGVIHSDQIKNLDWIVREAEFIEQLNKTALNETLGSIKLLIF